MSRLTDLLRQLRNADPQLSADLEKEINALTKRRTFGLVFERHQPEAVELPGQRVGRTAKVRVLPPRGDAVRGDQQLWRVESLVFQDGKQLAHLIQHNSDNPDRMTAAVDDLVVVAEFDDKFYPGLVETGRVENGGDKPFHTVINAENFHALEMLTYTHRGTIDAIYIDPPYNTGARDWKYNNDYVEGDDDYRHSKWLAFMERRLLVARELLNPDDSVLIVTIDEKEYLRLGMLLEQTFTDARIQMNSIVVNSQGTPRVDALSRVDEYMFTVQRGQSRVQWSHDDMLAPYDTRPSAHSKQVWYPLIRSGTDPFREDAPNQFYPIFLEPETLRIHSVGASLPLGVSRESVTPPESGLEVVWPILGTGRESRWQLGRDTFILYLEQGFVRAGKIGRGGIRSITYLRKGTIQQIIKGEILATEKDERGAVVVQLLDLSSKPRAPKTIWNRGSHEAGEYGSKLLRKMMPDRKFPFPKSLYAVEDALGFFIKGKPEAKIVDFFSGSGTTAHAVMRLNRQDGGRRQSISITNNEVSSIEQERLSAEGLRPGDAQWEQWGICDYITKPRIRAAITGNSPDGEPIKGDYKFTDAFPMSDGLDENAAFFTLTYEAPLSVRHNRAFERIAPMLWLRAGATGRVIYDLTDQGWGCSEVYAVLENIDASHEFFIALRKHHSVRTVFVISDDDAAFQMVCRELSSNLQVVQLYESYLQNFEISQGRGF